MSMSNTTLDGPSMRDALGAAPNPVLGALIDALRGPGPMDPLALFQTQLDAQAQHDPQKAEILRLLVERRRQQQDGEPQEEAMPSEEETNSEHETPADETREERSRHARELHDTVNKIYAEVEVLRARSDTLAAALGACYLCFGDDPLCEECGGRGVPGSLAPEPAAFRKYVSPAVRRARAIETGRGRPAPPRERDPDQTGGEPVQTPGREAMAHHPFERHTKGRRKS